jgi:hypothetical protein
MLSSPERTWFFGSRTIYCLAALTQKKLTNDLTFVNPNRLKIPYNVGMRVTVFHSVLSPQDSVLLSLPAAIRQQHTPRRQEHASLPPEKICVTAAATTTYEK